MNEKRMAKEMAESINKYMEAKKNPLIVNVSMTRESAKLIQKILEDYANERKAGSEGSSEAD